MSASETPPATSGALPRFHWLRVAEVRQETPDAISVTFEVPPELAAQYAFRAGQYLTLRTTLDGEELRRSYSICSGEHDGELRIAIKRLPGGVFSEWAQRTLQPGTAIEVMTPTGRFGIPLSASMSATAAASVSRPGQGHAPPVSRPAQAGHPRLADRHTASPSAARVHVAIVAGSGITPVLSIMKTVLACEPHSHVFLFYGSRSSGGILFRGVIEDLKDRYLGRLSVFHVLSREQQDVDVLNGRLDQDKLTLLLRRMLGGVSIDAAYVCGPFGMIAGVQATLAEVGVPAERVHIERFTSALDGKPRVPPPVSPTTTPFATATVIVDGARTEIPVAEGEAVLDAALRAGLELPYACKGGMCCTCRARLLQGSVEMALNYSLEPWEIEAGFVLTCQAHPTSPVVMLDYDQR